MRTRQLNLLTAMCGLKEHSSKQTDAVTLVCIADDFQSSVSQHAIGTGRLGILRRKAILLRQAALIARGEVIDHIIRLAIVSNVEQSQLAITTTGLHLKVY